MTLAGPSRKAIKGPKNPKEFEVLYQKYLCQKNLKELRQSDVEEEENLKISLKLSTFHVKLHQKGKRVKKRRMIEMGEKMKRPL